eukprot:755282-Hanusia_phi.AAC.2
MGVGGQQAGRIGRRRRFSYSAPTPTRSPNLSTLPPPTPSFTKLPDLTPSFPCRYPAFLLFTTH